MKKTLLLLAMGLLCMTARAVPADPTPGLVTQPDGTKLTVVLHGDEFFNWIVKKNKQTYLQTHQNMLVY